MADLVVADPFVRTPSATMDQSETIFDDEGVDRISSYPPIPRSGMNLHGRHVDLTEISLVKKSVVDNLARTVDDGSTARAHNLPLYGVFTCVWECRCGAQPGLDLEGSSTLAV
jgi:hypothetical protein